MMKTSMHLKILSIFICITADTAFAQNDTEKLDINCAVNKTPVIYFKDLQSKSEDTSNFLCTTFKSYIADRTFNAYKVRATLHTFAEDATKALDAFQLDAQPGDNDMDYRPRLTAITSLLSQFDINNMRLPEFRVSAGSDFSDDTRPYGEFSSIENGIFYFNDSDRCGNTQPSASCENLLKDFGSAFSLYRSSYNDLFNNETLLTKLSERWDRFLQVSKSQTSLEVFLTTYSNQSHFKKNHLVGPPPYQIIALHPNLIYDSLKQASDGNQLESGLAVEWIGINYWEWKVPVGASLASIYVDRAGEKDIGHGLQLHFFNKYSVGWAKHGEENSFYITIDLLKMFTDKKSQYESYLNSYF